MHEGFYLASVVHGWGYPVLGFYLIAGSAILIYQWIKGETWK